MAGTNSVIKYKKSFSNSLIIHNANTKDITTVMEVWIPGLN